MNKKHISLIITLSLVIFFFVCFANTSKGISFHRDILLAALINQGNGGGGNSGNNSDVDSGSNIPDIYVDTDGNLLTPDQAQEGTIIDSHLVGNIGGVEAGGTTVDGETDRPPQVANWNTVEFPPENGNSTSPPPPPPARPNGGGKHDNGGSPPSGGGGGGCTEPTPPEEPSPDGNGDGDGDEEPPPPCSVSVSLSPSHNPIVYKYDGNKVVVSYSGSGTGSCSGQGTKYQTTLSKSYCVSCSGDSNHTGCSSCKSKSLIPLCNIVSFKAPDEVWTGYDFEATYSTQILPAGMTEKCNYVYISCSKDGGSCTGKENLSGLVSHGTNVSKIFKITEPGYYTYTIKGCWKQNEKDSCCDNGITIKILARNYPSEEEIPPVLPKLQNFLKDLLAFWR